VDGYLRADALGAFALIAANLNDYELAREAARESLALARESGDKRQIEWALRVLTFDEPDLEERRRLLDECERLLRELGNEVGLGWVTYLRGMTLLDEGKPDEAYQALAHAESILSGLGRAEEAVNSQNAAALALIRAGRTKPARTLLERSLRVACDLDATSSMMEALAAYAGLVVEDDPRLAARLLGVVEHAASTLLPLDRYYGPLADDAARAARERLGDLYEHERDAGRSLSLDEAVELALR
jgi:tetratricopeptide (TPR) repeat protein